ncbi:MAG: hypothetical protein ABIX10_11615 [Acidimicrobiales bacterium]
MLNDGASAALHAAGGGGPQQGVADGLRRPSGEGRDLGDGVALGEDELEDGVAEQTCGRADGDGPEPGDLAELVAFRVSPPQRFDVQAKQSQVLRTGLLALAGRWRISAFGAAGHLHGGVEGHGVAGLERRTAGPGADLLGEAAVDLGFDDDDLVDRALQVEVTGALAIGEARKTPLPADAGMGGLGVGVTGRFGLERLVAQLVEVGRASLIQQRLLGGGVGLGCVSYQRSLLW